MVQILSTRLHRRRPGFTLIELVVAMAVVLILGAIAYATYIGQIAAARTATLDQYMQQVATAMTVYQTQKAGNFPDATTDNTYALFVSDVNTVTNANLPASVNTASWAYATGTDANGNPAFTITATATGGNGHVLCVDAAHGTVDLGVSGTPASSGVSCQ